MTTPKTSIILTFYNNLEYVENALEQVANQTDRDFELVLVDDGSTDGTREKLASEANRHAFTEVLFVSPDANIGVAAVRNLAVSQAKGEYVWFLDCDDRWDPTMLEKLVAARDVESADIIVARATRTRDLDSGRGKALDGLPGGFFKGDEVPHLLLTGAIRGYLWNKLIRRELLVAHPFPTEFSQSDLLAMIDIIFTGPSVRFIPDTLYTHVERLGSITNSRISSFEHLRRCLTKVTLKVAARSDAADYRRELTYFKHWFYTISVVNTWIRLGERSETLRHEISALVSSVSVSDIRTVAGFDKRSATILSLMKTGKLYPAIYTRYLSSAAG
jgi:glycosyltransferase involved in cell wall biosynthesis